MTASLRRALLVVAVAGGLTGCSRPPAESEVFWRLVDTGSTEAGDVSAPAAFQPDRPLRPRGPARAIIADEMRYTFERPDWRLIYREAHTVVPADGHLTLASAIPPAFRGCERLLVRASITGATSRDTLWAVGKCTGPADAPRLQWLVSVPQLMHGQTVDLWVHVREMPVGRAWHRSFFVENVPTHARLALSYGIEPAGWEPDSAAVTFVVRAAGITAPLWSATLDPSTKVSDRRWLDATIPLDAFVGRALTLTLETMLSEGTDPEAYSVPAWGNPTILIDRPVTHERRWNVLLVSLDTLRAQSVGAYGNTRPTTPVLDALAGEGTLFETALAQSTLTPVSNMSLFSALYPHEHGVTDLRTPSDPERVPTLPEQLRLARYATGAVTEDGLLQPALGFERGFDDYRENKSADVGSTVGQIERTFQDALRWITDHRDQPFFLFVQTYQVHSPYTPPAPYRGTLGPLEATGPAASRDRYEEEIQYTDAWLDRLWSGVRELGLAERTLLIVTSDHGEEFGEHGALDHGSHLYDETLRVPLVMRAPGLVPAGLRVHAPVGLIDILPTVLELLELPRLARSDGRSLAEIFSADENRRTSLERELAARFLYAEAWAATRMLVDGTLDPDWSPPLYALRSAYRKLIFKRSDPAKNIPEKLEAYDLENDPDERRDLREIAGTRDPVQEKALQTYVKAATAPKAIQPTPAALADPATLEKLRALGYLR